jgi:hypothetical protein
MMWGRGACAARVTWSVCTAVRTINGLAHGRRKRPYPYCDDLPLLPIATRFDLTLHVTTIALFHLPLTINFLG